MVNRPMNPNAYSIGVSKMIDPRNIVAGQLKTLMAEGTATRKLSSEKYRLAYIDMPVTNMWCPQTRKPITAIPMLDAATKEYPNTAFREKQLTSSLITPIPGRIMM